MQAIPVATMRWVDMPVSSPPPKVMRPRLGGVRPRIERISERWRGVTASILNPGPLTRQFQRSYRTRSDRKIVSAELELLVNKNAEIGPVGIAQDGSRVTVRFALTSKLGEEAYLTETFGQQYLDYKASVRRWL